MSRAAIDLHRVLASFEEQWSPRIVAQLNDYHLKVAKIEGPFVWHKHDETDEAFLVLKGHLKIELRDGTVALDPGQLYVVGKGVEHKPVADEECHILLIEPAGTVNTGDAGGPRTVEPEWVD